MLKQETPSKKRRCREVSMMDQYDKSIILMEKLNNTLDSRLGEMVQAVNALSQKLEKVPHLLQNIETSIGGVSTSLNKMQDVLNELL